MKILLLSVSSETFFYSQVVYPFGLASIGTYANADGHTVYGIEMNQPWHKIPDRYMKTDHNILSQILMYSPQILAISTYSSNIHNAFYWSRILKEHLPVLKVVFGGNHASYLADEILTTHSEVDFVIRFEGEHSFKELCKQLSTFQPDFSKVPNLSYRTGKSIKHNNLADLIKNLDTLPLLKRDFFGQQDERNSDHADIVTARGCPFHCTFCNCNHYWRKTHRFFSTERIINEIRSLKTIYPKLRSVRFRDETITVNFKHCKQLCEALINNNFNLNYQAHSRIDALNEEIILLLKNAGFNRLYIGVESGSSQVLKKVRKGFTPDIIKKNIRIMQKHDLPFRLSFLLSTPDETIAEAQESIRLAIDLGLKFEEFYFGRGLSIYPGTKDCETFLEKNPEYKWLESGRTELNGGYTQITDKFSNRLYPHIITNEYSQKQLSDQIQECFKPILKHNGFANWHEMEKERSQIRLPIDRERNNMHSAYRLKLLFESIEKCRLPWLIIQKGLLMDVYEKYIDDSNYFHLNKVLKPFELEHEANFFYSNINIHEINYIVLFMSNYMALKNNFQHFIIKIFGNRCKLVFLEQYLLDVADIEKDLMMNHIDIDSLIKLQHDKINAY